jgi:hypothetical protein
MSVSFVRHEELIRYSSVATQQRRSTTGTLGDNGELSVLKSWARHHGDRRTDGVGEAEHHGAARHEHSP